jgi:hypothetical protein
MTASSVSRNRERQGCELIACAPRLGRLHQWWMSRLYQERPLSSANDVSRDPLRSTEWATPQQRAKPIARKQVELEHLSIVVVKTKRRRIAEGRADR